MRECFGCRKQGDRYRLIDRKGEKIKGICHCDLCYNVLYSEDPVLISKKSGYLRKVLNKENQSPAEVLRIELTTETGREVKDILSFLLEEDSSVSICAMEGHFRKEVM